MSRSLRIGTVQRIRLSWHEREPVVLVWIDRRDEPTVMLPRACPVDVDDVVSFDARGVAFWTPSDQSVRRMPYVMPDSDLGAAAEAKCAERRAEIIDAARVKRQCRGRGRVA